MQLKAQKVGYVLVASGISGAMIALATEQSDYDPVAFGIATFSILLAAIRIALVFSMPSDDGQAKSGK